MKTILGSCVAVCLWDGALGLGGINHFLLPTWSAGPVPPSDRFGDVATARLIALMRARGCAQLKAKVFGGACVLEALRRSDHLGVKNAAAALEALAAAAVQVVDVDVGGSRGRKLTFRIQDGATSVTTL